MFDSETEYSDAIVFIFGGDTLPDIGKELQSRGATVASGECPDCGGTVYDHKYEVICGNCSMVIGADTRTDETTRWEYFRENRPSYYNSDKKKLPGGFADSYDWVEREDIDHPVKQIDPELFYGE